MNKYTNELINETSPYLLQHAHNPVDWYPWGNEAFEKAQKENKPILVSIGYAACHWCHVMERESFENEEIASIMNTHFVCIKVDREERPDVDQVYMEAVQRMTGHGGWPLNCFVLPDGSPFYGGTYFRPSDWKNVLLQLKDTYTRQPEKIKQIAKEIKNGLQQHEILVKIPNEQPLVNLNELKTSVNSWKKIFDTEYGGANKAPKFPMPNAYEYLLQYYYVTHDKKTLQHVELSLERMYMGGIYDHVGGGFSRYAIDKYWKVPHFEKMLYDNAQLVSLYSQAYQLTNKPLYKKIIQQTLEYIDEEMSDKNGGFYSSLDADSEGIEGKYYVWKKEEINSILGENTQLFCDYFNVRENGNWENKENILHITNTKKEISVQYQLSENTLDKVLNQCLKDLKKVRSKRIKPGLDDKILTSWNALMIKGYIDAYNTLGDEKYLQKAIRGAKFIDENLYQIDGGLWRSYKNGVSKINAFLDDYSFTIEAYIALYQATFDETWIMKAKELVNYVVSHFKDKKSNLFFYTSDKDDELIVRKKELYDNVIPASNSSLAKGLFKLGSILGDTAYIHMSQIMLKQVQATIKHAPTYHSNWAMLALSNISPFYELVIVGKDALVKRKSIAQKYLPNVIIAGSTTKKNSLSLLKNRYVAGETYLYLCKNHTCQLPVKTGKEVLKQIK